MKIIRRLQEVWSDPEW